MEEKIWNSKKNGMTVLLLSIVIYVLAIIGAIVGRYAAMRKMRKENPSERLVD